MKEINIENVEEFINSIIGIKTRESVYRLHSSDKMTRKKVKHTITTTTFELIEDGQLIKDLVEFCNNRYVYDCRHINEVRVIDFLLDKYRIMDIYKYAKYEDETSEYIYVMDYPDIYNYRWEGDYCPDAEPTVRRYSFSDVLDEFIDLHPDKCRWKETVETKVIEED